MAKIIGRREFVKKTAKIGISTVLGGSALSQFSCTQAGGCDIAVASGEDYMASTAWAVDAKMRLKGKRPHLVSVLPEKELIPTSIKYFEGNLGLYNSNSFFARDIFGLKKGIKGDYEGGYSVYVIQSKEDEVGQKRFDEIKNDFEASPRYNNLKSLEKELFMVEDRKNRRIFISFFKDSILIVVGAILPHQAKEIFSSIQENRGK